MGLDRVTIITLGSALPPAVGIFGRLEGLLRKDDTGLDEIVDLVRVDPALTFQIIRLGNSIFYGFKSRCDSLEEAVARIGFGDIHSLVGLVAARHTCQGDLQAYQIPAQRFWENSVATGQVMAAFAKRNGTDTKNAYSTGLMRNLGRIVLNSHGGAVRYPGEVAAPDLAVWEKNTYKITAAEVGAVLLEHWRFAPDTVAAVRAHLDPTGVPEATAPAAMLHLAGAVVAAWGYHLPGEQQSWQQNPALLALAQLTEESFGEAALEAREGFDKIATIKWAKAA